ncbi:hypothetical protein SAMN05421741_1172 [Paenimyroides ummariense]|uniref:Uncharacterized protein n=1 Tax=Paenimyroides ummariense TaxID=913024 RepID=A0A1I5DRR5_9FLAO|nr:hypothetical protein [Paenimyroides ummariense]SFO01913.1 hypothetical protein SAMN05421741_1172 [Paenimyroides ummariense]
MKLYFFKTHTNHSNYMEKTVNDLEQQVAQQLCNNTKASSTFVKIVYTFTSEHGRNGSKFAAKLAEANDDVIYFLNEHKKYQITGIINKIIPNEQSITKILTYKIEMANKYKCVLSKWNITSDENIHRLGLE